MKTTLTSIIILLPLLIFSQNDQDSKKTLAKDVVLLDDQIVLGSTCVGLDCSNGEVFDFNTIKLKENNLRIKFDDTSVSASFPNNDWELVANESNNGGLNKFSLHDATAGRTPLTVLAGAPQDALFVHSTGSLGLGTDNPSTTVHIKTGNSPAVRFEQTADAGFNARSWDLGANESHFYIRDNVNSKNYPFRVRPAAPHNALYVSEAGNIGLGTEFPTATLHVEGNGVFTGTVTQASDERLKRNILPIANASVVINALKAVSYDLKIEEYESLNLPSEKQYGLLAQQVESVIPELVSDAIQHPNAEEESLKAINYVQLIPILIKANQEQNETIQKLMDRIDTLEKQMAEK